MDKQWQSEGLEQQARVHAFQQAKPQLCQGEAPTPHQQFCKAIFASTE
jgi:hypothetical protein